MFHGIRKDTLHVKVGSEKGRYNNQILESFVLYGSFRVKSSHHPGSISWIFFKFAESFWSYEKTLKPKF